jgi:CRISPR-associated protein Cas1
MTTATDLIPVRALNQVTYCPRLYYLEYVESVMPINEHVEDGLFLHRRVDDPELQHRRRKEGDVLHTRSVEISSERLGISAKLDLVEEKDGLVYPVEYKRGCGPPADNGGLQFWDNDAVQLCAQALLLEEEMAISIPRGILYYIGSKRRVEVSLDESLRDMTLQAIRTISELGSRETPPEPLPAELRHRCFGCSLATICQPEETLYCLGRAALPAPLTADEESTAGITRVLPQSADGAVLYLQEPGSHVGKRSEHLVVRKDGAEIQRVPIAAISQVVVFGNVQLSTQALACLATLEIPVVYASGHGKFIASLMPAPTKNVALRANQVRIFSDPEKALALAKAVVKAKISNQRTLLMRSLRSRYEPDLASGGCEPPVSEFCAHTQLSVPPHSEPPVSDSPIVVEKQGADAPRSPEAAPHINGSSCRGSDEPSAQQMAELLTRIDRITDPAVLLGTEGQAAALYFSQFGRMLKAPAPGAGFDFRSRNRRPPRDPVNALLSFAYAMLLKDCFSALCTVGFDPYLGFFHASRHGKPSLALDLMEEFRAVIADSVVLTLINNRMLVPGDFLVWRVASQLTEGGRRQFFLAYEQRKATIVRHPVFGYQMSYSRMLEVQARMLAAYVRGDIPSYTGFVVR